MSIMTSKVCNSVDEVINNITNDTKFKDKVRKQIQDRQFVRMLTSMRVSKNLSQADIAREMGCDQPKVSKLENGFDDDLRLGDLRAYMKAMSSSATFIVCDKDIEEQKVFDRMKFHAFGIRNCLQRMGELAKKDDSIAAGVARSFTEGFMEIARHFSEHAKQLPPRPEDGKPYISIFCDDSVATDGESLEDETLSKKRTRPSKNPKKPKKPKRAAARG